MNARAIALATAIILAACGDQPARNSVDGVEEDDRGIVYCNGTADCAGVVAACAQVWCQPVRDEPNPDNAWGVCRAYRAYDAGACDDRM